MSEEHIRIILHRLDQLEEHLGKIHEEVLRTNGRVKDLELEEARMRGREESRRAAAVVGTSVISGGILAGIIWFVSTAV